MTDGDLTVGREATRVSARPRTVSGAQRLREKRLLTGLLSYGLALAVVVGSEGKGLSRLTREKCDFLVRLPMVGTVESLNAAVAGSIVLYAARQARST